MKFYMGLFLFFLLNSAYAKNNHLTIVQMFQWSWEDLAKECTLHLGPAGYSGVMISPPNEHVLIDKNPWYERYQLVSYQINSRSGDRQAFKEMIQTCHQANVEIYADVVINHTTGLAEQNEIKNGYAGSTFSAYSYPDYEEQHFHKCGLNGDNSIKDYKNRFEVQNCNLAYCLDLKTSLPYVQQKLTAYLNDLISLGVDGFRVDAAKHIPVEDMNRIYAGLTKPVYIFQEVVDYGGEGVSSNEYIPFGDITEFKYAYQISHGFKKGNLERFRTLGTEWWMLPSENAISFVDNHDLQRKHLDENVTHKNKQLYTLANIFLLAWPYGRPKVMSSYEFSSFEDGPPMNELGEICGIHTLAKCESPLPRKWVMEHRWLPIKNMVHFRKVAAQTAVKNWWSNGHSQIAFARGDQGFVVINNESYILNENLTTLMEPGKYCDVVTGNRITATNTCSGKTITVNAHGMISVDLPPETAIAIHNGEKLN